MTYIGYLCPLSNNPKQPIGKLKAYRIVPVAQTLEKFGKTLFVYSPYHLNPKTGMVPGYVFAKNKFIKKIIPVPKINGNWFFGPNKSTRRGETTVSDCFKWMDDHQCQIFPSRKFSQLSGNKLATYDLISHYLQPIMPRAEPWDGSTSQLARFLGAKNKIFIKPINGREGNDICTIERHDKYHLKYYCDKKSREMHFKKLMNLNNEVKQLYGDQQCLIQYAIDNKRLPYPLSFRSIMLNDGDDWYCVHHVIAAVKETDVSNLFQGGETHPSFDYLIQHLSYLETQQIINKMQALSHRLANYLNSLYDYSLFEMAFDFVFDDALNLYLLEINRIPGVGVPGFAQGHSLEELVALSKSGATAYTEHLLPRGQCLAKFLLSRESLR